MTSDNHVTGPVSDAMLQAGRIAWAGANKERNLDAWLGQVYLAMKSKEQASVHSTSCKYCGMALSEHEPSGCCGDGGGSTFEAADRSRDEVDRVQQIASVIREQCNLRDNGNAEQAARSIFEAMKSKEQASVHSPQSSEAVERVVEAARDAEAQLHWGNAGTRKRANAELEAAITALSRTDDRLREALERVKAALEQNATALTTFIYMIAQRFDGDGGYYWMRDPTHDDAQAAMAATNEASAAITALQHPAKEKGE